MTKILTSCACAVALASFAPAAAAGSPGGLVIAVAWTDAAKQYIPALKKFLERYDAENGINNCNDAQLNIDSIAFGIDRNKLDTSAVSQAIDDPKKRKNFGSLLSAYRDRQNDVGFDGALFLSRENSQLVIKGISARPNIPVQTSTIPLADVNDIHKFDLAVCKALVKLPVIQEP